MLALDPAAQAAASTQVNNSANNSTAQRHVVLVAGYDYSRTGSPLLQGRNSFRVLCNNRVQRYFDQYPIIENNENWRFTVFDFKSGEVLISVYDNQTGIRSWSTLLNFAKVSPANYSDLVSHHPRFDSVPLGRMSITDVYDYVCEIGEINPGSLLELSIFAHGWAGGPILVNYHEPDKLRTDRHEDDKDARTRVDFKHPVIDLVKLRNAFHKSGFIWTWGCAFTTGYKQVLQKLIQLNNYSTSPICSDDEVFSMSFTPVQSGECFPHFPTFFPQSYSSSSPTIVSKTLFELKKFFRAGLFSTYSQAFASAAQRPCYGAALGTYADFGRETKQLMRIPNDAAKYGGFDFTRHVKFYTTYLGAEIDPEGRGYIKYPI